MKTILEFDSLEEVEEIYFAQNGQLYSLILQDLDNWLRTLAKYQNKKYVSIEAVRAKIRELKEDYEVK